MNSVDLEILRFVNRVRRRMIIAKAIESIFVFSSAAMILGIGLIILSRFIPIYDIYTKAAIIQIPAVAGAIIYAFINAPDKKRAALKADSFELNERTVTALELMDKSDDLAVLEKQDALKHLKKLDIGKNISLKPRIKYGAVFVSLLILIVLTSLMPDPLKEKAAELHRQKAKIAETQKKVDKIIEKVNKNSKLTEEQKNDVKSKLRELKKELKTADSEKALDKALQRWEKKIELVKQEYANDDLERIADTFAKSESTKQLAEMIKKGNAKAIKKSLDSLAKELKTMTPSKLKELTQGFNQLAKDLKNSPELKKAFSELANKITSGELGDIQGELEQISKELEDIMYDPALTDALAEVAKELDSMQMGQPGLSEGNQAGNQPGGMQPGNSSGKGKGANGGGAGNGSDKGQENQKPTGESSGTGIGKKDGSDKKLGNYEKIFTPKNLGGEGETSSLTGKQGKGGNSDQIITDNSPAVRGEDVPYNQIIGEYKYNAIESMEGSTIPSGMKELVKNYFSTLEE